jgi:hypothetical protein
MKIAKGRVMNIFCGVVMDGAPCNEDHTLRDSTVGWLMDSEYGSLFGSGKTSIDIMKY